MRKIKECPSCGYEGLMDCVNSKLSSGELCNCPKCDTRFGKGKNNVPDYHNNMTDNKF
jgi:transcription elongation factor Elf1